jgi:hypothetical protein
VKECKTTQGFFDAPEAAILGSHSWAQQTETL